jgi:hypothetical protein
MAKNQNPGKGDNQERTGSKQGKDLDEQGRKATSRPDESSRQGSTSGKQGGRSESGKGESGERSSGSSRNEEATRRAAPPGNRNEELSDGREAIETEGLDVDQLDEERENI